MFSKPGLNRTSNILLNGLLLVLLSACSTQKEGDYPAMHKLELLQDFQKVIHWRKDYFEEKMDKSDAYNFVDASNFESLFGIMKDSNRRVFDGLLQMLRSKEIVKIRMRDINCIELKIYPDYENNLLKKSDQCIFLWRLKKLGIYLS